MNILTLPNGKILQAIQIDKVDICAHFPIGSKSGKFYVQVAMKGGAIEQVAERLSETQAAEIQRQLLSEVKMACAEIDPYEMGRSDGWQSGYSEGERKGYDQGRGTGYSAGFSEGCCHQSTNIQSKLIGLRHSYKSELDGGYPLLAPRRRRYLNNAIGLLDDLIGELSREAST